MHRSLSTLHLSRRHQRSRGALAVLLTFLALAVTGLGIGHLPAASAATSLVSGQPGTVSFWSGTGPSMLNGVPLAKPSTGNVVTAFVTSRMFIDPAPLTSGPDLTQSVGAELRLQRWDDASAAWATVETKRFTVDLSKESGTATGNTYAEIAPIRFANKTAGTVNGTLTWARYRVVGSFTWVLNSDHRTLGTLTITPKELNEVACVHANFHCGPGEDGQTSFLWAA